MAEFGVGDRVGVRLHVGWRPPYTEFTADGTVVAVEGSGFFMVEVELDEPTTVGYPDHAPVTKVLVSRSQLERPNVPK